MKIYVCGGSSELDAVSARMQQLRETGHTITHDWTANVRSVGDANPRTATHEQRSQWAADDLRGIEEASLVWVMLPIKPSFGCAFEAGAAVGAGTRVIISGDWRATIFSSQAYARFNEHDHALEWIRLYGTPGEWGLEMSELEAV
jgi:hypothetical protein